MLELSTIEWFLTIYLMKITWCLYMTCVIMELVFYKLNQNKGLQHNIFSDV